jgi:hypothetical protein
VQLERSKYSLLSARELEGLLLEAELLQEIDTLLNRQIRLFRHRGQLFLQEYSFDGDIIVRPMESREAADALIESRLDIYERMWDGCGCKINFFE